MTSEGGVGGVFLNPGPELRSTWDGRRSPKLRVVAGRTDFQALLGEDVIFDHIEVVDMNERREFVGRLEGTSATGEPVERFLHVGARGVRDLGELLRAAGLQREVTSVVDVNDRGAVLLRVRGDGRDGAVVLSPNEG
ncbi:MAG: hypothetical protein GY769_12315 [bacterium]|nr:hypothetical protein [bacterium]